MSTDTNPTDYADLDPYETLGVAPTATASEIRTAYRKLALSTHPDKAPLSQREAAHTAFQRVAFAYAVLSDEKRRARYDATGSTSESVLDQEEGFDWGEFFKSQYQEVSVDAVKKFRKDYQGSEEERQAILTAYTESKGSLDSIFEEVMCSSPLDDEARFCAIIDAAIESGEVEAYKAYTKETKTSKVKRRKAAEQEAKEAAEYAKELGVHDKIFGKDTETDKNKTGKKRGRKGKSSTEPDMSGLEALIKARNANRMEDLVRSLEEKHGGKSKGGKRARIDEPDEMAFQTTRAKLEANSKKRSKRL